MKEQKTIAEIMTAKAAAAVSQVTDLLWADADGNKVATVAISGGLTVEKVQELEGYVANAKAELAKLDKFDVAKLKADAISAKAAFQDIADKFKRISDQRNQAARTSELATKELYDAQQAYTEIADQIERGELPQDKSPELVTRILTRRQDSEKIHAMGQRLRELIKLKKDQGDIINQYQKQVDQASSRRANVVSTPGGFVPENEVLAQRLEKYTTDQAAVVKAIAKLETDISAAVKAYERFPSPFSIETKAVSNDG